MTREKFVSLGLGEGHNDEQSEFDRESSFDRGMSILGLEDFRVGNHVEELEKLDEISARPYKQKLRVLKQSMASVLSAIMTLAVLAEADYKATRYDVNQVKIETEIIYEHQDMETTHWLNYLSGNEELSQKLRLSVFRDKIEQELKTGGVQVPKSFSEMSYEDIKLFIFTNLEVRKVFSQNFVDYYTVNGADILDDYVPSKLSKNSKIYTTLWSIEGIAGNPKIRSIPSGRAYYYPPTNTMYINIVRINQGVMVDNFLSEASHGIQWQESSIVSYAKEVRDAIKIGGKALYQRKGLSDMVDEYSYKTPGMIEYEAHDKIQPILEEYYQRQVHGNKQLAQK